MSAPDAYVRDTVAHAALPDDHVRALIATALREGARAHALAFDELLTLRALIRAQARRPVLCARCGAAP